MRLIFFQDNLLFILFGEPSYNHFEAERVLLDAVKPCNQIFFISGTTFHNRPSPFSIWIFQKRWKTVCCAIRLNVKYLDILYLLLLCMALKSLPKCSIKQRINVVEYRAWLIFTRNWLSPFQNSLPRTFSLLWCWKHPRG